MIKIRKNHREIGLANERKPMPPVIPRRSPHTMTKKLILIKYRRFVSSLRITSVSKGAVIRGSAPPFAWIEGVNVSAALRSRRKISDTRRLARADNIGRFECRLVRACP